MNDSEIAKKANRCNVTIYNWRKRNNLAPNGWQKLTAKELQDIREMYYKGLNDCEIAKKINRCQETICRWRKKNNLIPNGQDLPLPRYYKTTIYTDDQRQLLWLYAEDKGVKWVKGFEVIGANTVNKDYYERLLKEKNENGSNLDGVS